MNDGRAWRGPGEMPVPINASVVRPCGATCRPQASARFGAAAACRADAAVRVRQRVSLEEPMQRDRCRRGHVAAVVGADAEFTRPVQSLGCRVGQGAQTGGVTGAHLLVLAITQAQEQETLATQLRQLRSQPLDHRVLFAPQRRAVCEARREQLGCREQRMHDEQAAARMSGQDAGVVAAITLLNHRNQLVANEAEETIRLAHRRVRDVDILAHARWRVVALSRRIVRTRNADHDQFRRQTQSCQQCTRLDHARKLRSGVEHIGHRITPLRITWVTGGQVHHIVARFAQQLRVQRRLNCVRRRIILGQHRDGGDRRCGCERKGARRSPDPAAFHECSR